MKNFLMITAIVLISTTTMAQSVGMSYATLNFKKALKIKVGDLSKSQELKLSIVKTDEPVCGGAGLSLVATLEIKRSVKEYNQETGEIKMITVYKPVKSYAVALGEAEQLTAQQLANSMMADDQCLE